MYKKGLTTREIGKAVDRSHAWVVLVIRKKVDQDGYNKYLIRQKLARETTAARCERKSERRLLGFIIEARINNDSMK